VDKPLNARLEKQINTERSVGTDNARYQDPSYILPRWEYPSTLENTMMEVSGVVLQGDKNCIKVDI
jgi:hypothetical protein